MTYPTVAEIVAMEPALSDLGIYPTTYVTEKRLEAIARIEDLLDRAFVPTTRTHTTRITDGVLRLPRCRAGQFRSWTSLTVTPAGGVSAVVDVTSLWVTGSGRVISCSFCPGDRAVAVYSHGDDACPVTVREAVAAYTRVRCTSGKVGGVSDRAERFALGDSGQVFALAVPGLTRLGYPSIDAVLADYSLRVQIA